MVLNLWRDVFIHFFAAKLDSWPRKMLHNYWFTIFNFKIGVD